MISALLNFPVLVVVSGIPLITDYGRPGVISAKDSETAQRCCPPPRDVTSIPLY